MTEDGLVLAKVVAALISMTHESDFLIPEGVWSKMTDDVVLIVRDDDKSIRLNQGVYIRVTDQKHYKDFM